MGSSIFDKWGGRVSNLVTVWPVLVPAGAVGIVMGWLAKSVAQINQFGPFGWCFAGLLSFLVTALALYALSGVWGRWIIAKAAKRNAMPPDSINPLEMEFHRRRIKLLALAHPIDSRIRGKRFIDCELEGPANIVLVGHGVFRGCGFLNCDFVIHRQPVHVQNCVVLEDCEVIGGEIHRCTIFVDQDFFDANFGPKGVPLVSYERPPNAENAA